jgi:hypothetical protein
MVGQSEQADTTRQDIGCVQNGVFVPDVGQCDAFIDQSSTKRDIARRISKRKAMVGYRVELPRLVQNVMPFCRSKPFFSSRTVAKSAFDSLANGFPSSLHLKNRIAARHFSIIFSPYLPA